MGSSFVVADLVSFGWRAPDGGIGPLGGTDHSTVSRWQPTASRYNAAGACDARRRFATRMSASRPRSCLHQFTPIHLRPSERVILLTGRPELDESH